jgi:hypothetical protein
MNDLEKYLRVFRLAPPSADLDRRMQDTFKLATGAVSSAHQARGWWWLATLPAAGAAAALLLLLLRPSPPPAAPPVRPLVYQIEPHGLMRELLLTPPARLQAPPVLVVSVRL